MTYSATLHGHEIKTSSDRSFGFVFTAVFLIIGLEPLRRSEVIKVIPLVLAAVFLAVSLIYPRVLAPLNRLWTRFGLLIAKITNPIVLGLVYFVVLTPLAVISRLFGRDPLEIKLDRTAKSYWVILPKTVHSKDRMRQQF